MSPALTPNAFCILAMRTTDDNFAAGFIPVGPFPTEAAAAAWARVNIADTEFDNPHWVVAPMVKA